MPRQHRRSGRWDNSRLSIHDGYVDHHDHAHPEPNGDLSQIALSRRLSAQLQGRASLLQFGPTAFTGDSTPTFSYGEFEDWRPRDVVVNSKVAFRPPYGYHTAGAAR
jgi:hypothetical protein